MREAPFETLESVGLAGPELDFKMAVFDAYFGVFLQFQGLRGILASPDTPFGEDTWKKLKKGWKEFKKLGGDVVVWPDVARDIC